MSIPLDTFTPVPVVLGFLPPLNEAYLPLYMRATGGVALGDGSQGREIQFFSIEYLAGSIVVKSQAGAIVFSMAVANITTLCLAFDSNMNVTICYTKADGSYLYFFNAVSGLFETMFLAGANSCRVCVDKPTFFFNTNSDVLWTYSLAGVVYWRQQRDRYTIQRTVGPLTAGQTLRKVGPSLGNRLQIEMST